MRKLLLFVAIMFAAMHVMAADVDALSAQSLAQRFLMSQSTKKGITNPTIKWVHQELNSSNARHAAYYIVNTDAGFVIVAGDDRAHEILAYGEHPLDNMNTLPENMKFWLDSYKGQVEYLQAHPGLLVGQPMSETNRGVTVEPMLEAKWLSLLQPMPPGR